MENINQIAESSFKLKFPPKSVGAIQRISQRTGKSLRSVSRAIHAKKDELSEDTYLLIRTIAVRDLNAYPIRETKVKL